MQLDHLAVAGQSLQQALAHIEAALGVAMQPGGQHGVYGSHNYLLGLADGLYLEAISIDPQAVPERRPRWFDLDNFSGEPRLCNWICRCEDLELELRRQPAGAGQVVALQRGDLRWKMAVPQSGRLPFDNMFPALIEWQGPHPAVRLEQRGCALRRLVVAHPQSGDMRATLGLNDDRVVFESGAAGFEAEFDTPHGRRVLR